jgi:hypothetical protein
MGQLYVPPGHGLMHMSQDVGVALNGMGQLYNMCWTRLKLTRLVGGAMCLCFINIVRRIGQLYVLDAA